MFAAGMVGWVEDLLFDRFFGLLFVGCSVCDIMIGG